MRNSISSEQQPLDGCFRIGYALWTGKKAGAETYVLNLTEGLSQKRPYFKIRIIFFTEGYDLRDTLRNQGIDFVELHLKNGYDFPGLMRFLLEVYANGYDIIHFHESTAISILLLKIFPSLKVIYTEHSSILPLGIIRTWLYRLSIRACDKVFFVSCNQRDKIIKKLRIQPRSQAILPLGIDCVTYNDQYEKSNIRKDLGYADNMCIIAYVGRFTDFKRVDKVIKAAALLQNKIENLRLLLIGFGDILPLLKSMVIEEGIDNLTNFYVSPNNVIDLQRSVDFLVHPSEHESMGLSVLEAMALGKVVVINNFESANEIVESGKDGIIINNISPEQIADAVEHLWKNNVLYKEIAHRAVRKIKQCFDFNRHCDAIIGEYEMIIHKDLIA